ncbi:feruloyl esterase [Pleomassaria siparia CBS 279.74]|uniref:Carboxylic ester hydrolase n=1 Tax=Pleomassaria siparia CBS 279.74 TaxID=1314801 RepID=A0A6G1K089_9PLEO|nr:feruloyl esterase [Pleomassaria siparia CBS 279.74]
MRHSLLLASAIQLASAAVSSPCSKIANLTGIADLDSWAIVSANSTSAHNVSYCDVAASIGGRIRTWYQLPTEIAWNGRYVQIGCGGACGYNPFENTYFAIDDALQAGYALGTTDMGVPNSTANYDPMHKDLQMRIDWGHLATHLTAITGKQIVEAFYGSGPEYSYHLGSSTGGRQSLVEAQRYPEDFNGVFAIAPAYNETGVTTYSIAWTARAALLDETEFTPAITGAEADLVHAEVLRLCDGLDGLEDGIVSLPRLCHPDLSTLACSSNTTASSANATCLSATALKAAKKIYSGPISSLTGAKQVPEGLLPGSETAWKGTYVPSTAGSPSAWYSFAKSFLSFYAFWPDPAVPLTPFSIDLSDPELLKKTSKMESLEFGGVADMDKFKLLGGKIIMTSGLQDVAVAPGFCKDLWERVGQAMGVGEGGRDGFMRFYELPGVNHVSGGPGADTYDALGMLADWVEEGIAPEVVVASHLGDDGEVEFTRPLYRYPFVAGYNGTGDVTKWESFGPMNGSVSFWEL